MLAKGDALVALLGVLANCVSVAAGSDGSLMLLALVEVERVRAGPGSAEPWKTTDARPTAASVLGTTSDVFDKRVSWVSARWVSKLYVCR